MTFGITVDRAPTAGRTHRRTGGFNWPGRPPRKTACCCLAPPGR